MERATVLIYEECRILKRKDVDSIFEPMLEKRIPVFLNKSEEYEEDPMYEEDGISIYITSAGYKTEWFWNRFKEVVNGCFTDKMVSYNFFAFDIYNILKARLRTIKEWMKIKRTTDPLHLMIEYQNVMIGSADNCFYSLDLVKKCQKLRSAFYPPTEQEALVGSAKQFREKKDNEIRILAVDYAFANTTNSSQANDNTVIQCLSGFYDKSEIVRNLDYLETLEGGESELTQRRIRELFQDYKADYLSMDLRSGGEIMYVNLTKPYNHPTRSSDEWDSHGFTVVLDMSKQFLPEAKITDLHNRRIDPEAKQCIIPIQGSLDFNDSMWRSLYTNMRDNKVRLLIDSYEFDNELSEKKGYFDLTSEEKMRLKLPYVQTELLINEAVNLKQELREGKIKLVEPRSLTKDRIVTLAYGNLFFDKLENKLSKEDQRDDFDESDWKNIFVV